MPPRKIKSVVLKFHSDENCCTALCKKCLYSELFWTVFSRIRAEYGETGVSLPIQTECWKIRTRITPNKDTFYAALVGTKLYRLMTLAKSASAIFLLSSHRSSNRCSV